VRPAALVDQRGRAHRLEHVVDLGLGGAVVDRHEDRIGEPDARHSRNQVRAAREAHGHALPGLDAFRAQALGHGACRRPRLAGGAHVIDGAQQVTPVGEGVVDEEVAEVLSDLHTISDRWYRAAGTGSN
jgi:hypothetical protein